MHHVWTLNENSSDAYRYLITQISPLSIGDWLRRKQVFPLSIGGWDWLRLSPLPYQSKCFSSQKFKLEVPGYTIATIQLKSRWNDIHVCERPKTSGICNLERKTKRSQVSKHGQRAFLVGRADVNTVNTASHHSSDHGC